MRAPPLHIPDATQVAETTQRMARAAGEDGKMFQKMAMVSMGAVTISSVAAVLLQLLHMQRASHYTPSWRERVRDEEGRGRGRE